MVETASEVKRRGGERLALGIVLALLVALPALLFAAQAWRTRTAGIRVVEVVARVPRMAASRPTASRCAPARRCGCGSPHPIVVHD